MNLPFTLPDWLPWWAPILLLVPALMWALAFLFMPFSVIGLKGRLEAMEAQLEELQSDVRSLSHRLPEKLRQSSYDDIYAPPGSTPRRARRSRYPSAVRPFRLPRMNWITRIRAGRARRPGAGIPAVRLVPSHGLIGGADWPSGAVGVHFVSSGGVACLRRWRGA